MSLLMWECGLKPQNHIDELDEARVTPYVGVWIETRMPCARRVLDQSLLMWECGLKPLEWDKMNQTERVTPYVGVWIET